MTWIGASWAGALWARSLQLAEQDLESWRLKVIEKSKPSDYFDVINRIGQQRDEARRALNEKLGEPVHFEPDPDNPEHGIGFWKANGGVVAYRKYSNGYDPNSRHEYTAELIRVLIKVGEIT